MGLGDDLQRLSLLNDKCDLLFREVMDIDNRLRDALTADERHAATELLSLKRDVLKETEHQRAELLASVEQQRRTQRRTHDRERER